MSMSTILETRPPAKTAKTSAAPTSTSEARSRRRRLPAVLMRAGTSRGLFLHRHDLPDDMAEWGPVLIAAMGSRLGDPRQLEGVGGATSTTSKVAVVSASNRPGVDVEYTFVQVTVGAEVVDLTGNCGNMASGVGAFALDEGLVTTDPGASTTTVSVYNTNTDVLLEETIAVDPDTGLFDPTGDYRIPGVKGPGSLVKVKFVSPCGSMTGKTFPTGLRQQSVHVTDGVAYPFSVTASLVDVSNPFVFVDARTMPPSYDASNPDSEASMTVIEAIRRHASVLFGFAANTTTAGLQRGTPKISLLSAANNNPENNNPADIHVFSYSMGKAHPSFQLTGAVCLGAAVCLEGTVAADLLSEKKRRLSRDLPPSPPLSSLSSSPKSESASSLLEAAPEAEKEQKEHNSGRKVVIQHRSGTLDVEVDIVENCEDAAGVTVYRTARRVFEGVIYI